MSKSLAEREHIYYTALSSKAVSVRSVGRTEYSVYDSILATVHS